MASENKSKKQEKIDAYVAGVRKNLEDLNSLVGPLFAPHILSQSTDANHSKLTDAITRAYISPQMEELIDMHPAGKFVPPPIFDTICRYEMDMVTDRLLSDSNITVRKRDPDYLRYIIVKGKASFECPECSGDWISHNASLKFGLYEREVVRKYRRMCTRCYIWADLYLTREEFEVIAKRVIQVYKKRKKAKVNVHK